MHTQASNKNTRTGRCRLIAVGAISLAASLSALAQTATPAPATTTQATGAQPAVTTTTTTTTTSGQTAAPSDQVVTLNEFTVNGSYAGSLELAAQEKQAAPGIVEVIAPEDIGKLPDVSIADALARLTDARRSRAGHDG